jgi:hypothetical protein
MEKERVVISKWNSPIGIAREALTVAEQVNFPGLQKEIARDGTVCEVVWAGDMTRHGEKGGLLEPRATRSLDIREHAPGQIDIYQHVRSDQTAYHRAKNKARLKARRQRQRDAQPVVRKRAVAA